MIATLDTTAATKTSNRANRRANNTAMETVTEIATLTTATEEVRAVVVEAKKVKGKKAAVTSAIAESIITASMVCGVLVKEFGSESRPSAVIKLPAWSVFKASLPEGEEGTAMARAFHALRDAVQTLAGDVESTWVLHRSGSFALYSRFSK